MVRTFALLLLPVLLGGCPPPVEPVTDYFQAQKAYAQAINAELGGSPTNAVVAPTLFLWDIGWILQGANGLGQCPVGSVQDVAVTALPPSQDSRRFVLGAQLPDSVTNGIVAANLRVSREDLVQLDYEAMRGRFVGQSDLNGVLSAAACQAVIRSAVASGGPVTVVRGQVLARQKYTWLRRRAATAEAQVVVRPGAPPIGFTVQGGTGPDAPLVLTETDPRPHFLLVQTFEPRAIGTAQAGPGIRPQRRRVEFVPVPTPTETLRALETGRLGGTLPRQP